MSSVKDLNNIVKAVFAVLVLLAIFWIAPGGAGAQSLDSIAKNNATQCKVVDLAGVAVMPCNGNPNIPQDQIAFGSGNCYEVSVMPTGTTVAVTSCDLPPFGGKQYFTCASGTTQVGLTAETACAASGGTEAELRKEANNVDNPERDKAINCSNTQECFNNNPIVSMLKVAINTLTAAIGIIVTVVIIWAGIEYASSGGDPGRAAQARKRILNAILALIMFVFLWALLQWLVPGSPF